MFLGGPDHDEVIIGHFLQGKGGLLDHADLEIHFQKLVNELVILNCLDLHLLAMGAFNANMDLTHHFIELFLLWGQGHVVYTVVVYLI